MTTVYLLYVLAGGGLGTAAWGGPALVVFDDRAWCEAAAEAMRGRKYVFHSECIAIYRKQL